MKNNWLRSLGILVIAMLTLGLQANAASLVISSTSFDFQYVPNSPTTGLSQLCDGQSCAGGVGNPAQADAVTSMSFTLVGSPNQLIQLLTSNIYIDMNLTLAGLLQLNGTTAITGGYFDLLVKNSAPAWGLAINITGGSVNLSGNGLATFTLLGSAQGNQCVSPCAGVNATTNSFGFIQGPFTISFSSITGIPSGGSSDPVPVTTAFKANGSPDVTGTFVPEPMTMSLMGAGLVGLALLRRRVAK